MKAIHFIVAALTLTSAAASNPQGSTSSIAVIEESEAVDYSALTLVEELTFGECAIQYRTGPAREFCNAYVVLRGPEGMTVLSRASHILPPYEEYRGELSNEEALCKPFLERDEANPAPLLSRCVVVGPGGSIFFSYIASIYAGSSVPWELVVIPIRQGKVDSPRLSRFNQGWITGAFDQLRAWRSDFFESEIVSPGHVSLARVPFRFDGREWVPVSDEMKRAPMALSVRAKLCEDLRKSSERIADVAAVLAERTYSGNCHDGKMILDEVFQSDPAGRAQFLSLFRDELASGASELELVRKLNGGSLGIFEKPIEQATGLVVPP